MWLATELHWWKRREKKSSIKYQCNQERSKKRVKKKKKNEAKKESAAWVRTKSKGKKKKKRRVCQTPWKIICVRLINNFYSALLFLPVLCRSYIPYTHSHRHSSSFSSFWINNDEAIKFNERNVQQRLTSSFISSHLLLHSLFHLLD